MIASHITGFFVTDDSILYTMTVLYTVYIQHYYIILITHSLQTHAIAHPFPLMDTPDTAQEKQTMETTSITTVTVGIVVVVALTEHVSQVVLGQEVSHCV